MIIDEKVELLSTKMIEAVQGIIKIKSVEGEPKEGMPYGEGPGRALEYALKTCEELGFNTVNLDGYVGYAEYGEGEDYIAVLGHLDVVPEGDGWQYPPYGAEIHDGKLYGRGTMDDKGPIIAALFGLKGIVDAGLALSKRVRIIFGTNEESGCNEMEYYRSREKLPVAGFTPDAEYPIIYAEKGLTQFKLVKEFNKLSDDKIIIKHIKGGLKHNMVPDFCEAVLQVVDMEATVQKLNNFIAEAGYDLKLSSTENLITLKSFGVTAHGSVPQFGKNAIMQLLACIGSLELPSNDSGDFIRFMNEYVGMDVYGVKFGVGLEDQVSGKLSFNVGVIDMDEDKVVVTLNLRYPVTYKLEDMMAPFEKRLIGTGIRVEGLENNNPLYFPEDHPLIKILQRVYKEQTGQEATLLAIGGGTYAKEMPNTVAFGPLFPGKPDLLHKANEYIEIEDLILNAKIYAHAIYELAK
jgi:succinyl-diaminopimelate desuccinylase